MGWARLTAPALQVKDLVTDSTRFKVESFIPLVKERLGSVNPYVRQFLLGWITHLDNIPDVDMLEFLPEYLEGVMAMLGDDNREIRVRAGCGDPWLRVLTLNAKP